MTSEDDDKHLRDNTSPEHKPSNARNYDNAPKGQMGTRQRVSIPTPTNGVKIVDVSFRMEVPEQSTSTSDIAHTPEKSDEEKRADYLKSLPEGTTFTAKTGDAEVDKKSLADGDVPVTKEELKSLKAQEAEKQQGPQISQSDYAKAFRQAHGQTQAFQKDKGHEID